MKRFRLAAVVAVVGMFCVGMSSSVIAQPGGPGVPISVSPDLSGIIYVRADGAGNGSSWEHATSHLQAAIHAEGVQEVWVAEGTYYASGNGFAMRKGVAIHGGFPNGGDPDMGDRDWDEYATVLTRTGEGSVVHNEYIDFDAPQAPAVLSGVTVRGGNYTDGLMGGGGMYNFYSSPMLTDVRIEDNSAAEYGGGMFNRNSDPTLINVVFSRNTVLAENGVGGGMYNVDSAPVLVNVVFHGNKAAWGGGIMNARDSYPAITNCTFYANEMIDGFFSGGSYGSAIAHTPSGQLTVRNSIFWGNFGGQGVFGGSISLLNSLGQTTTDEVRGNIEGDPLFVNAESGNVSLKSGSPAIDMGRNDFLPAGVTTDVAGNPRFYADGTVDIGAYEFQGGPVVIAPGAGGVIYVKQDGTGSGGTWADATSDLQAAIEAAGVQQVWVAQGTYTLPSSLVMKNGVAIYGGFQADDDEADMNDRDWRAYETILSGGGARKVVANVFTQGSPLDGTAVLDGFVIRDGVAAGSGPAERGGGIYNEHASPTLRNLVVRNNEALSGGGIYNTESSPTLEWVELIDNVASGSGGGLYNIANSSPLLRNVIIRGNEANGGSGIGGGIFSENSALSLINVLIAENKATYRGGGMYSKLATPSLTNVTITNNTAGTAANNDGGAMVNDESAATARNVLIYGNWRQNGTVTSNVLNPSWGGSATYFNSLVQGGTTADASGNLSGALNPMFAAAENGDYSLANSSPLHDRGDSGAFWTAIGGTGEPPAAEDGEWGLDLAGNTRVWGDAIDIGAYEIQQGATNIVPSVSNVAVSGTLWENQPQNLTYTFSDIDGGEDRSTFQWFRSNDDSGAGKVAIDGATGTAYTLTSVDIGKYISVVVTPYDGEDEGAPVESILRGPVAPQGTVMRYVREGGDGDGSSWGQASGDLQAMIEFVAQWGGEVWVAQGTYYSAGDGFGMRNGVAIYGGFRNTGTPALNERDWQTYTTILSGSNERRIFYHSNFSLNSTAVLDGFYLEDGFTTVYGGAMHNSSASPTLKNLVIRNNEAEVAGGAVYNQSSSPAFTNVVFENNVSDGSGGAVYNSSGSSPVLTDVVFRNNRGAHGGAMYSQRNVPTDAPPQPVLVNALIVGNHAQFNGSGISNVDGSLTLVNVTLSDNTSDLRTAGGAIYNWGSGGVATIQNSIIWNNYSVSTYVPAGVVEYGNFANSNGATAVITNSLLQDNHALYGTLASFGVPSDVNRIGVDPLFANPSQGDYTLTQPSPAVDYGNSAFNPQGADLAGNPRVMGAAIDLGPYESNFTANTPPTVSMVMLSGSLRQGETLTGTYQFDDADGDDDHSTMQWYRSNTAMGDGKTAIQGAGSDTYTLTSADIGKFISFRVTPSDGIDSGVWQESVLHGPVLALDPVIRYVRAGASGNGLSWLTPMGDLQAAIDASFPQDQVWVAAGTYVAPSGGFRMKSDVAIYGGFPASGQPGMDERYWRENPTILSGGGTETVVNNLFTSESRLSPSARLDGFEITDGSGTNGGGIYNEYASPTLANLRIYGNVATNAGGGMYGKSESNPTLRNVEISDNEVTGVGGKGGGIYVDTGAVLFFTGGLVGGNRAPSQGGGIFLGEAFSVLTNVTIAGNSVGATDGTSGGGIMVDMGFLQASNTVIASNWGGGGTADDNESVINNGFAMYFASLVQGVTEEDADANLDGSTDPLFLDAAGGGYMPAPGSPLRDKGGAETYWSGLGIPEMMPGFDDPRWGADIGGNPRVYGGGIDIGGFEINAPPEPHVANVVISGTSTQGQALTGTYDFGGGTGTDLSAYQWYRSNDGSGSGKVAIDGATDIAYVLDAADVGKHLSLWVTPYDGQYAGEAVESPLLGPVQPDGAVIRYVREGASGDGAYWSTASGDIQAMVNFVATWGGEVWVAEGTYVPTASLVMRNNVAIYGGFPADDDAADMDDRDWQTYETVVSGGGARRVVANIYLEGAPLGNSAVLDGFVIRDGWADPAANTPEGRGGGIRNSYASPVLRNLLIMENEAYTGGGLANDNGSPLVGSVTIRDNKASFTGAGIANINSQAVFQDMVIESNSGGRHGAGMYNVTSDIILNQSVVRGNSLDQHSGTGAGIGNSSSSPKLTNVLIVGNTSSENLLGGGMSSSGSASRPELVNVTITGNGGQAAIHNNDDAETMVYNSIVSGQAGGAAVYNSTNTTGPGWARFSHSIVENGWDQGVWKTEYGTDEGGNLADAPGFKDALTGDYTLAAGSPAVNAGHPDTNGDSGPAAGSLDLGAKARLVDCAVDLGAFERQRLLPRLAAASGANLIGTTLEMGYVEGGVTPVIPVTCVDLGQGTGKTFTYSVPAENGVAAVEEGELRLLGVGETTLTILVEGDHEAVEGGYDAFEATLTLKVLPGAVAGITLSGPVEAEAGALAGPFTLKTVDMGGNEAALGQTTAFSLSAVPSGSHVFYSDASGESSYELTQISIHSGESEATFWYRGTLADLITLTATAQSDGEEALVGALADHELEVVPSAPAQLSFAVQPSDASAGNTISPSVEVRVEDEYGNLVDASWAVSVVVTDGAASLEGETTVAASAGVARFDDLSVSQAGTYTLTASAGTDPDEIHGQSTSFVISPGSAHRLVLTTAPAAGASGALLDPQPSVEIHDAYGNVVDDDATVVSVEIVSGEGGQLGGTQASTGAAAVDGTATFSGLTLSGTVGETYALEFSAPGLEPAETGTLVLTGAGAAARLAFGQQPADADAGETLSTVTVRVEDAQGNLRTDDDATEVSLSLSPPATATLAGTATATVSGGVATFNDLSVGGTGTFTLTAEAGGLAHAVSQSFSVLIGSPDADLSSVAAAPSGVVANGIAATTVSVTVKNGYGVAIDGMTEADFDFGFMVGGSSSPTASFSEFDDSEAGDGIYRIQLTNTAVEVGEIAVTVQSVGLEDRPEVGFVGQSVSAADSELGPPNPAVVVADGQETSTLTVTVRDSDGIGVAGLSGAAFVFGDLGDAQVDGFQELGSGGYSFALTDTTAETVTPTLSVSGVDLGTFAPITFIPGPVSFTRSEVGADPISITADGVSKLTVTVSLRDAFGNLRDDDGDSVFLAASDGSLGTVARQADGTFEAELTSSTVAGEVTVFAYYGADAAGPQVGEIVVQFTAGDAAVGVEGSLLSGADLTRIADGMQAATLSVQLRDQYGNAVAQPGVEVVFDTDLGDFTPAASVLTDENGLASVQLTSATVGIATVTAQVDLGGGPQAVTNGSPVEVVFEMGAVDAAFSSVSAESPVVLPDSSMVTVMLRDANDHSIDGLTENDFVIGLTGSATAGPVSETVTEGTYTFVVANSASETVVVTVTANGIELDTKPEIVFVDVLTVTSSTLLPRTTVDQPYSVLLETSGGMGPFAWSLADGSEPLPDGLELETGTGILSGAPVQTGTFSFKVYVEDGSGQSAEKTFTLMVNPSPALSPAALPVAVVDQPYAYPLAVDEGTGTAPFKWYMAGGELPEGLALDPLTGRIAGTPTQTGSFIFTVRVADHSSAQTKAEFSIDVVGELTVSTTALPHWTVGRPGYPGQLEQVGGDAPFAWSLLAGELPEGMALEGDGTFSGIPQTAGTHELRVGVRDANGNTAEAALVLMVHPWPTIASDSNLSPAVAGEGHHFAFEVSGGTAPFHWAPVGGSLPDGLALNEHGVLSGTASAVGPASFTVMVTDAAGATDTLDVVMQVQSGRVSAEESTMEAESPVFAGSSAKVTLMIVDANGNPVIGLTDGDFSIDLSPGASKTAATSMIADAEASAVTEMSPGVYEFYVTSHEPGTLNVSVTVLGVTLTATAQIAFALDPSTLASVNGTVWRDGNLNGLTDAGEGMLAGWTVYLDANENGRHDADEPVSVTDAQGRFLFDGLLPGSYRVGIVLQAGWQLVTPGLGGFHEVMLDEGAEVTVHFGVATDGDVSAAIPPEFADLTGHVWYDFHEDGMWGRTGDEPSVSGWKIHLEGTVRTTGQSLKLETQTDADGNFEFRSVPRGEYRIRPENRRNWVLTYPQAADYSPAMEHHVVVDWGFPGVRASEAPLHAGRVPGWLSSLKTGRDTLYSGALLQLDTDLDGRADRTVFLSGLMEMSWTAGAGLHAEVSVHRLSMRGPGDLELHASPAGAASGALRSSPSDSLAELRLHLPFVLTVDGQRWIADEASAPVLSGLVDGMLPRHRTLSLGGGPVALRDPFGRHVADLVAMEWTPLYGADFGVNQSLFGSAPANRYPVNMEDGGARHVLAAEASAQGPFLGTGYEEDQLFVRSQRLSPPAVQGGSPTWGVSVVGDLRTGREASVAVAVKGEGYLHAWLDFDRDGRWTASEKIADGVFLTEGVHQITFDVPAGAVAGDSWARFRLCDCPGGLLPVGVVSAGEVEDHPVSMLAAESGMATGVNLEELPMEFGLDANYPNPFNPTTTIRYRLAETGPARLQVFDMNGRLVGTLVDQVQARGEYTVAFDASGLSSGVYVYRLTAGGAVFTGKLTLLK